MAELIPVGTRVEISFRALEAEDRVPGLPPDTARLPYEVRVRGLLVDAGRVGSDVEIETQAGRRLRGRLIVVQPGDTHTFGKPHPAFIQATSRISDLIDELQ